MHFVTEVRSRIITVFSRHARSVADSDPFLGQEPLMVASLFKHEVYSSYRIKRMNSNERFSIGELSKATGVKVVTIRYYEHVKLMPEPGTN